MGVIDCLSSIIFSSGSIIFGHTMMLVCEYENTSMWAFNICISRYPTTIEGAYNINNWNKNYILLYKCVFYLKKNFKKSCQKLRSKKTYPNFQVSLVER